MRRVVVTGIGIVSPIGNDRHEVLESLRNGRSGIVFAEEYKELGFRSQVHGSVKLNTDDLVDRKLKRFMGEGAAYNYIAMEQAIADAGLEERDVSDERTGLIFVFRVFDKLSYALVMRSTRPIYIGDVVQTP